MRGLEKIYGAGQDDRHAEKHFNTMNRPGLRAGSIENVDYKKNIALVFIMPPISNTQIALHYVAIQRMTLICCQSVFRNAKFACVIYLF